uniref:K Homology domain-containing protein n=1 Tax=Cyprinus carpio TaxID=7962 RepID=A0A8C2J7L0_CYPCA
MADYSNVAPPSSNAGGGMNDAFKDALQRARQIAAKIGGDGVPHSPVSNEFGYGGQKRPLEDGDQPETKKVPPSDPFSSVMGGMGGMSVQEIMVPASKAGLVIGKGGETIKQLQVRCTNAVKPETSIYLVWSTFFFLNRHLLTNLIVKNLFNRNDPKTQGLINHSESLQAKDMVMDLIRDQGFREQRGEYGSRAGGGESLDVPVPRFAVGIVIGRNGEMIKKIQNDTGVRIQFKPDDGSTPERIAQIMGPPDRAQHAADIMSDLLRSVQAGGPPGHGGRGRGRGQGNWNMGPPGGLQEFTFTVPTMKTGLIIGKGGETIKNISQQSGARIELQRNPPPNSDPNIKIFTVRGSPQQIDYARQLVEEKIGGPVSPMGGPHGPPGPHGGPSHGPTGPPGPPAPMGPYNPGPYGQGPPGPHGPPAPYQAQGWGNGYPHWQQGQPDPTVVCSADKAAADANAAAWAAYYSQYQQQPQGPMTPTSAAPGTSQTNGQGDPQAPGQSGQADYTKAWEEYYKKLGQGQPQQDYTKAWEEYYKKQGQAAPQATAAAAASQPGGQPDYSAAWAEYYRQQAAYYGQGTPQAMGAAPQAQQGQ